MKILLTHVYSWPEVRRGGERYLHELGAALARAGHEVRIVSTAPEASSDEVLGVPVLRYRRRRDDLFAAEAALARRTLLAHATGDVDVWHALGTADAAAAARLSRFRRTRSVYTDLGGPLRSYRSNRPDHERFEYAVKHLDAYVCLSQATAELLTRDYRRSGTVVHGGVDLAQFEPSAPRSPTPTVLFASANDEERKNLPLLLAAFDVLLATRQARLVLAGPGDATKALDSATARVRAATDVVGPNVDLSDAYSEAWTTVLPSQREAFGLVLVESLACGTPIVALADSGGPTEIVKPGVGALAAEATPEALAHALNRALQLDDTAACRAAALPYDWDQSIVPQLLELYTAN
ncbi:MAG: glycosyltransferase family 4 protein [Acidimicrobiales bacterium]|nr:glycosyltransferase family 4 protein [Acidimicrobiales bacterium]